MRIAIIALWVAWACIGDACSLHSVQAAEMAVAQSVAPTVNGGTQDLVSTGFGVPSCALVFGGYGNTNGSMVNHAGFWFGAYDGTNQNSMGFASENAVADADTGSVRDTNSALITIGSADQLTNGEATASFISDGVRLTWSPAPPSAYLINSVLFGGAGVANCHVGTVTTSASQDGVVSVTAPAFLPDLVLVWTNHNSTANVRNSLGWATREAGPSIAQRAIGMSDQNAAASMSVSSRLTTNRIVAQAVAGLSSVELTGFTATGFELTTRDADTGPPVGYMAIRFNGLSAKTLTATSPTTTGTHLISGAGFSPQGALMLQGEFLDIDTTYATDNGEVFGVSAMTPTAQVTSGTYHEDSDGTSITRSLTDNKPCHTIKDSADYAVCSMNAFTSDGVSLDYSVTNSTSRKMAVLFLQSSAIGASRHRASPMEID